MTHNICVDMTTKQKLTEALFRRNTLAVHKLNYEAEAHTETETTNSAINNPNFIHKMFQILMKLSYYLSPTIKSRS